MQNRFVRSLVALVLLPITSFLLSSCRKNSDVDAVPPAVNDACVITGETSSYPGNPLSFNYEYDAQGRLVTINHLNTSGLTEVVIKISNNFSSQNNGKSLVTNTFTGNLWDGFVSQSVTSMTNFDLNTSLVNYKFEKYLYDSKQRLIKISQHTERLAADPETYIDITYDKDDNVISLGYKYWTGPRETILVVNISAYDNKPSVYTGLKNLKFTYNTLGWLSGGDALVLVRALSRNNPLEETQENASGTSKRTMTYTYNTQGFPVECLYTYKFNTTPEITYKQTFSYACK